MSSQLFPDDIPTVFNTYKETVSPDWSSKIPNQLLSIYSEQFLKVASCIETRQTLEKMYQKYCALGLADKHFLSEIRSDDSNKFHQRTWEMWMALKLDECNYQLAAFTGTHGGPDLIVDDSVYIECVAASDGQKGICFSLKDRVQFEKLGTGLTQEEVERDIFNPLNLRITSALDDKRKKYEKYLDDKIINPNFPRIIAINTYGILGVPHLLSSYLNETYFRVLFGLSATIGFEKVRIFNSSPTIPKVSGEKIAPVPAKLFTQPEFQIISAIIFYDSDIINALLGDIKSMGIIYNLNAKNPLGEDYFAKKIKGQVSFIPTVSFNGKIIDNKA